MTGNIKNVSVGDQWKESNPKHPQPSPRLKPPLDTTPYDLGLTLLALLNDVKG